MRKLPLVLLAIILLVLPAVSIGNAEWVGDAQVETSSVRVNFMERFSVSVTNSGQAPLEIVSVSVTVNWDNMPTLYPVFEGSVSLSPGDHKLFTGPSTRMPNVAIGEYSCFARVVIKDANGLLIERRFPSTVTATQITLSPHGVPEELFFPLAIISVVLGASAILFRFERQDNWPFYQAVPRWTGQKLRRT